MSTWQIFSDGGDNHQWKVSHLHLHVGPNGEANGASAPPLPMDSHCLPSMADLLVQGFPKLEENCEESLGSGPIFRTGMGKAIPVKQPSILKALTVLGGVEKSLVNTGQIWGNNIEFSSLNSTFQRASGKSLNTEEERCHTDLKKIDAVSNSMFQTGSGKAVHISSAGLHRAKRLLGLDGNGDDETYHATDQTKKQSAVQKPFGCQTSPNLKILQGTLDERPKSAVEFQTFPSEVQHKLPEVEELIPDLVQHPTKPPPIKFQTAGGRYVSISCDALQRARSLLGDPELDNFLDDGSTASHMDSFLNDNKLNVTPSHQERNPNSSFLHQGKTNSNSLSNSFTSPIRSNFSRKLCRIGLERHSQGNNLIKKFDAAADTCCILSKNPSDSQNNGSASEFRPRKRSSREPLKDSSNANCTGFAKTQQTLVEKRNGGRSFISPYKRPRSSKFVSPMESNTLQTKHGLSTLETISSHSTQKVLARYPHPVSRRYMKNYFEDLPRGKIKNLPHHLISMNADNAETYIFPCTATLRHVGPDAMRRMLCESGASLLYISREWVANHYKWIVWKLASYERCYPAKFSGKLLTIPNVLEELKYRYERELNLGHRSAIKRILEGDAPPSVPMVLCVSSIYPNFASKGGPSLDGPQSTSGAKVQLTDGWYSVTAILDLQLSEKLAAGKLFIGQKLRIWGANLCGWIGPISPLEASKTTCLLLHINGTYRAHWGDRLGFCKNGRIPLAFRSIKCGGGPVPCTLVGISRVYPVLYGERLATGEFIVRCERMENKEQQSYDDRRCSIVEGVLSDFHRTNTDYARGSLYGSEGPKLLDILERAAEPELIMAEMTPEQLNSFSSYKKQLEASREINMQKCIEKALKAAGLDGRDVTPFMRVRVAGLALRNSRQKGCSRMGLITIWNPTEKQKAELIEGKVYAVAGLAPTSADSNVLYLQARGSSTKWLPFSARTSEYFEPFFFPRKSISLHSIGDVPYLSEFDIAAYVVHVGEQHITARQKQQWVFVTDASLNQRHMKEKSADLMAISFRSSTRINEAPVNYNLAGCTVGFCNLIKEAKDQTNNLWVAEATENTVYFLTYDHACCSHLKGAAVAIERWANISSSTINKLTKKVIAIINPCP